MSFDNNKCLEFLRDELAVQEANYKEIVETNAKKLLQEGEHLFRGKIIKISESQIFIKFRAEFGIPRINSTRYLCHFLKEEGRGSSLLNNNSLYGLLSKYSLGALEFSPVKYIKDSVSNDFIICIFSSYDIGAADKIHSYNNTIVYVTEAPPPTEMLDNLIHFWEHQNIEKYSNKMKNQYLPVTPLRTDDPSNFIVNEMATQEPFIVQGPPGSGKSYTISLIISKLCEMNQSVLVVSLTNRALIEIANKEPLKKLLNESRIFKTSLTNSENKELPNLNRLDSIIETKGECHLVTSFKASSCLLSENFNKYDYVLIDEASELTLPMLLGTINLGYKSSLFGDIFQLPPVVVLDKAKIEKRQYSEIVNGLDTLSFIYKTFQLVSTYRLPEIAAKYTSSFYRFPVTSLNHDRKLCSVTLFNQRMTIPLGVFFIFTKLNHDRSPQQALNLNMELINSILSTEKKAKIAVLAHMKNYVNKVMKLSFQYLPEKKLEGILFETVHRIQGLTCDYAIFTATNYLNSLRNINLFNVATSRAQKLTFVILDEKYSNPFYNRQNLPPQIANYLEKVIEDNMFIRI